MILANIKKGVVYTDKQPLLFTLDSGLIKARQAYPCPSNPLWYDAMELTLNRLR